MLKIAQHKKTTQVFLGYAFVLKQRVKEQYDLDFLEIVLLTFN